MNDTDILELARAAGIARDWTSANGQPMQVSPESLHAILQALDLPCATDEQCRDSRAKLAALQGNANLPPLITGTAGHALHLPPAHALAGKSYCIEFETGGRIEGRFADDAAAGLHLPAIGHAGYHRLLAGEHETALAIAPPRCFGVDDALRWHGGEEAEQADQARLWGLGVQLYSLRRQGDGGIGDFSALATLAQSAAAHGAAALAISPVHAMFSADVHRFSPYGPSSRLFLNALHIDPAAVLGRQALAAALADIGDGVAARLAQFEQSDLIDWPAAGALRLHILRRLYRQFTCGAQAREQEEFERFRAAQGSALRDHARFEALHAWRLAHGESGDWRTWPQGLRDPKGSEVEAFARAHADEVRFHEFLQWQAARGLSGAQRAAREAGMPIGLIADLAVGADNDGSQAWSRQKEIIDGLSVGAPPDVMNMRGQSWGLGAFSPHAMKARGFGAYIEMLRATFAYAGGARIDHVLGLSRLWLVPHGAPPTDGAYLRYPMEDLLRLIALESWRHQAIVIGENLGTVPAGFDRTLAQSGLLGIQVLLFQQWNGRFLRPEEWSRHAIATTTTHDLPSMIGWWRGRDIDWRRDLDLLESGKTEADARNERARECVALWQAMRDAGCAHGDAPDGGNGAAADVVLDAAIGFMAATPAPLAMLPAEDALGLSEQPNLPGTVDTHPNWRRRLPHTVEDMLDGAAAARRLQLMGRTRTRKQGT